MPLNGWWRCNICWRFPWGGLGPWFRWDSVQVDKTLPDYQIEGRYMRAEAWRPVLREFRVELDAWRIQLYQSIVAQKWHSLYATLSICLVDRIRLLTTVSKSWRVGRYGTPRGCGRSRSVHCIITGVGHFNDALSESDNQVRRGGGSGIGLMVVGSL